MAGRDDGGRGRGRRQAGQALRLLHDIGKALTHEQEGSHVDLSVELPTKYNEPRAVLNTILSGTTRRSRRRSRRCWWKPPTASRRRARRPPRRAGELHQAGQGHGGDRLLVQGVDAAYAIQAGRELRIITKSDQISDLDTYQLAKDIAKRIEAEMQYPGHIKVTVIRSTARPSSRAEPGPPGCSGTLGRARESADILCIGDVFGEPGRRALATFLPRLRASSRWTWWSPTWRTPPPDSG